MSKINLNTQITKVSFPEKQIQDKISEPINTRDKVVVSREVNMVTKEPSKLDKESVVQLQELKSVFNKFILNTSVNYNDRSFECLHSDENEFSEKSKIMGLDNIDTFFRLMGCNNDILKYRYENLEIIGRKAVYSGYVDDSGRRDNSTCTVEVLEDGDTIIFNRTYYRDYDYVFPKIDHDKNDNELINLLNDNFSEIEQKQPDKPNNSGGSWILEQYLKQQAVDFTKFAANQLVDRSINKAILNMIV